LFLAIDVVENIISVFSTNDDAVAVLNIFAAAAKEIFKEVMLSESDLYWLRD
jgi:hypothetical protein